MLDTEHVRLRCGAVCRAAPRASTPRGERGGRSEGVGSVDRSQRAGGEAAALARSMTQRRCSSANLPSADICHLACAPLAALLSLRSVCPGSGGAVPRFARAWRVRLAASPALRRGGSPSGTYRSGCGSGERSSPCLSPSPIMQWTTYTGFGEKSAIPSPPSGHPGQFFRPRRY